MRPLVAIPSSELRYFHQNPLPKDAFWQSTCRIMPPIVPRGRKKTLWPTKPSKVHQQIKTALWDFFSLNFKVYGGPLLFPPSYIAPCFLFVELGYPKRTIRSKSFLLDICKFDEFHKREIFCQLGEATIGSEPAFPPVSSDRFRERVGVKNYHFLCETNRTRRMDVQNP